MTDSLRGFVVRRPALPMLGHGYCVIAPAHEGIALAELLGAAETVARREATLRFGDPECFTLLFNAGRTRRRPWPHVHIILASSVKAKRRAMLWLLLENLLRPRRWRVVARLLGPTPRELPPCP